MYNDFSTFALDFNMLPVWWLLSISQSDLYMTIFATSNLKKRGKWYVNVAQNPSEGENCIVPYLSGSLSPLTAHWSGTVDEIYICTSGKA